MTISVRSMLTAGIATVGATSIVLAPSVSPPPPGTPPSVELAAGSRPLSANPGFAALVAAQQRAQNSNVAASLAVDQPSPALLAFPGAAQAIKNIYDFAEYWVDYGVDLVDYFVGFIPFGYLIGDQINIFYNSLEPIARSITYNIADWIGGSVTFTQGVRNVIRDSINAGINLVNAEIAYGFSFLPPLPFPPPQIPNLPWFGLQQATTTQVVDAELASGQSDVVALHGPADFVAKIVGDLTAGFAREETGLNPVEAVVDGVDDSVNGEVGKIPGAFTDSALPPPNPAPVTVASDAIAVQEEVRGTRTETVTTVVDGGETLDRGAADDAVGAAPKTAGKGLRNGARRVAENFRKTAESVQKTVRDVRTSVRSARTDRDEAKAGGTDAEVDKKTDAEVDKKTVAKTDKKTGKKTED